MMKTLTSLVLVALVLAPAHAFADEINGKTPAICAVIETVECTADRKCQHRLAGHVNMPTFLRIDFKRRRNHGHAHQREDHRE